MIASAIDELTRRYGRNIAIEIGDYMDLDSYHITIERVEFIAEKLEQAAAGVERSEIGCLPGSVFEKVRDHTDAVRRTRQRFDERQQRQYEEEEQERRAARVAMATRLNVAETVPADTAGEAAAYPSGHQKGTARRMPACDARGRGERVSDRRKYYVVLLLHAWDQISLSAPFAHVPVDRGALWGCGFLPVYQSREEAAAEFPAAAILQIEQPMLSCAAPATAE